MALRVKTMTQSKLVSVALMFLAGVLACGDAVAQKKEKPPKKAKPVMVAVVQVDGEYQVIDKKAVPAFKKQLAAEHKDAVKAHKQAKSEAKKNKEKFDVPAPKAKKLKVVKAAIEQGKAAELIEQLKQKERDKARPAEKKKAKARPASGKGKNKKK